MLDGLYRYRLGSVRAVYMLGMLDGLYRYVMGCIDR